MEGFDCSKYKIDKSKILTNKRQGLCLPEKCIIKRNKQNSAKVKHFLDFIFGSSFYRLMHMG